MTRLGTVECSAEEFVWWLRRNRLRLPDLLGMSPSTRIETDVDEIVRWSQEDGDRAVRVANDPGAREAWVFPESWSVRLCAVAAELARLLGAPRWASFVGRTQKDDKESFAGGVAGRSGAVVILDDASTVRLVPVRPNEVAATMAEAVVPRLLPVAPFSGVQFSQAAVRAGGTETVKLLKAAHADPQEIEWVSEMEGKRAAGGVLGSFAYTPDGKRPGPFSGQWYESPSGGLLITGAPGETIEMEALTVSSLTRALVRSVASAQ